MTKFFSVMLLLLSISIIATIWNRSSHQRMPLSGQVSSEVIDGEEERVDFFTTRAGVSAVYQFEYTVQGDIEEAQDFIEPDLSVSGVLHVRFLAVDGEKVHLGMQLHGATIQRGNNIEPFDPGIVLNVLDSSGALVSQVTSKYFDEDSARFVKDLFNLQVTSSSDDSLSQWTVTERDSLGRYTVIYKKNSSGMLHKEKRQYLQENDGISSEIKIIQSFAEITLNPVWLVSYESMESIADTIPSVGKMEYTISRKLRQDFSAFGRALGLYALDLDSSQEKLNEFIMNQELSGLSSVVDGHHNDRVTSYGSILIHLMQNNISGMHSANSSVEQGEDLYEYLLGHPGGADFTIKTLQKIKVKSEEAYGLVEKLLAHHPDDNVRMAALDFFVQDDNEQYFGLVIDALDDRSKKVRLAAAQGLLESKYDNRDSVVHGLINRLNAEEEVDVKGALYLALSPHRKDHPEIDVLLKEERSSVGPELIAYIEEASR